LKVELRFVVAAPGDVAPSNPGAPLGDELMRLSMVGVSGESVGVAEIELLVALRVLWCSLFLRNSSGSMLSTSSMSSSSLLKLVVIFAVVMSGDGGSADMLFRRIELVSLEKKPPPLLLFGVSVAADAVVVAVVAAVAADRLVEVLPGETAELGDEDEWAVVAGVGSLIESGGMPESSWDSETVARVRSSACSLTVEVPDTVVDLARRTWGFSSCDASETKRMSSGDELLSLDQACIKLVFSTKSKWVTGRTFSSPSGAVMVMVFWDARSVPLPDVRVISISSLPSVATTGSATGSAIDSAAIGSVVSAAIMGSAATGSVTSSATGSAIGSAAIGSSV